MKPREVDYLFIGTGIAPLLAAFRLRTTDASFFLLNPLPDYFQENLDFGFDPDWPLGTNREGDDPALPFDAEAKLLEEYFPGSLTRENSAKAAAERGTVEGTTSYFQRNRLFLRGRDANLWNAVEAAYVAQYDRLKPQTLSDAQAAWLFPGVNAKLTPSVSQAPLPAAPGDDESANAVLFPRTGVLDVGPYRNGLYAFLRENHASEIRVGAQPIVIQPEWVQFQTPRGPETIAVRRGAVIFWSPAIAPWVRNLARTLEITPAAQPRRQLFEEYRIVSKETIDAGTIGTRDHFSSWAEFNVDRSPAPASLLRVLRKVPESSPFTEASFLDLKRWITEFLSWDDFKIRGMRSRSAAIPGSGISAERWKSERLRIDVRYACDGPILRSIRDVNRWLAEEGL